MEKIAREQLQQQTQGYTAVTKEQYDRYPVGDDPYETPEERQRQRGEIMAGVIRELESVGKMPKLPAEDLAEIKAALPLIGESTEPRQKEELRGKRPAEELDYEDLAGESEYE
jgi:hypothetical protein